MAITSAVCNSFKQECMLGEHDLDTDVLKIALFTDAATLDASTTAYSTTNEVVGTGYTAGGETLTTVTVTLDGSVAIVDFDNVTWASADFTARGALIYNSSKTDKAIAVFDFGSNRTASDGDFVVVVPAAAAATAVIRLS
ncbi:MAG: hypothetical protein RLZZ602_1601 [Pseudomonadota bacterium]|jgi:hypothetical protein